MSRSFKSAIKTGFSNFLQIPSSKNKCLWSESQADYSDQKLVQTKSDEHLNDIYSLEKSNSENSNFLMCFYLNFESKWSSYWNFESWCFSKSSYIHHYIQKELKHRSSRKKKLYSWLIFLQMKIARSINLSTSNPWNLNPQSKYLKWSIFPKELSEWKVLNLSNWWFKPDEFQL